jgi:hypothetical protein
MFLKMAIKTVSPYLNKITDGLDAMAKEFGVEECYLMIRKKVIIENNTQKSIATLMFMSRNQEGGLYLLKDKQGNPAEYPIEKLVDLISGESMSEEED